MSVNEKMTAIADKIRALLGLNGTMGLDAMAANLNTEQTNVDAALAAIAEKGVTVPDGSTSDALASLFARITTTSADNIISLPQPTGRQRQFILQVTRLANIRLRIISFTVT